MVRTEISISTSLLSSTLRHENRGSAVAAAMAHSATTAASGSKVVTRPMHPRRRPRRCKVTKAPPTAARFPNTAGISGRAPPTIANSIDFLAMFKSARFSRLWSGNILRILFRIENRRNTLTLPDFDSVVHLVPEHQEIMHGRNDGANHHQPQQD